MCEWLKASKQDNDLCGLVNKCCTLIATMRMQQDTHWEMLSLLEHVLLCGYKVAFESSQLLVSVNRCTLSNQFIGNPK